MANKIKIKGDYCRHFIMDGEMTCGRRGGGRGVDEMSMFFRVWFWSGVKNVSCKVISGSRIDNDRSEWSQVTFRLHVGLK